MIRFSRYSKIYLVIASVFVLVSLVLVFVWGLNLGIDFRGGSLFQVRFEEAVESREIREVLTTQGFGGVVVQPIDANEIIIKSKPLSQEEKTAMEETLREQFDAFEELRFESIGPTIGRELLAKAYWQIGLVILGIVLYIAYAFRKISKLSKDGKLSSWKLGLATIAALTHDILITVGVFAVLGRFKGAEVDTLFVTALLTILGFSVHDTIVVFDRVRESLTKYKYKPLPVIVDHAINSTLVRSINTSSTLIFVLLALLLFGGETIFYFVLALLVGVAAGTYSSIFIASPLLSHLQTKK